MRIPLIRKTYIISSMLTVTLISLTIGGFYVAHHNGYIQLNHPDHQEYPIHGIDVSHHQGKIDWHKLDKKLVKFAYIKATEGADHKDTKFDKNWVEAKSQQIPIGGYHFFSFCKSGREQAINYIEAVPKDASNLPPVIDLEFSGNCKQSKTKEDLLIEVSDFIYLLESYYHKKVIIYSTQEFYNTYLTNKLPENPIWIRDILTTPKLKDGRKWLFWQYHNRGKIDGIESYVDLNVFGGSEDDFDRLLQ